MVVITLNIHMIMYFIIKNRCYNHRFIFLIHSSLIIIKILNLIIIDDMFINYILLKCILLIIIIIIILLIDFKINYKPFNFLNN